MKNKTKQWIYSILFFTLITGLIYSCNKTELPQNEYFPDIAKQNSPSFESIEKALLQIDTNIVDNYSGFGQYFPYVEYISPTNPLPLENFVFGGNPYGDLRGAMDTISGVKYRAYWFGAVYQGVFRDFIIFTLASDHNQNWVYTLNSPEPSETMITGQTITQTPSGNYLNGYGKIGVYGNANVPNTGVWDVQPFKDTQNKLYNSARWDLKTEAIYNDDTLRCQRLSYVRIGESSPAQYFTGVGFINAFDPDSTPISTSLLFIEPVTLMYQGNEIDFYLSTTDMNGFEIGSSIVNTGICEVRCQGFLNGQLVEIPTSSFSKITFISNRGSGVTFNAY
jgi:hypothetical protein